MVFRFLRKHAISVRIDGKSMLVPQHKERGRMCGADRYGIYSCEINGSGVVEGKPLSRVEGRVHPSQELPAPRDACTTAWVRTEQVGTSRYCAVGT